MLYLMDYKPVTKIFVLKRLYICFKEQNMQHAYFYVPKAFLKELKQLDVYIT